MQAHLKLIVAVAAAALTGIATAQTATDNARAAGRNAADATRDGANAVGRAASAAVTPGDQNMGRTPDNRSGGLMGNDRTNMNSGTTGTTGTMGTTNDAAGSNSQRPARADRG